LFFTKLCYLFILHLIFYEDFTSFFKKNLSSFVLLPGVDSFILYANSKDIDISCFFF